VDLKPRPQTADGSERMLERFHAWGRKHVSHGAEGEGCLEAGNYLEAEKHLSLAIADADAHRRPAATQIVLRLQLAEAQSKLGKLDEAKQTLGAATVFTTRAGNTFA